LWTNEIGEDENIKKIGEEISSQTAKLMDIEIGNAIEDINFESQTLDNPIGNLLTDVTRIKVNADIAFQNAGGVRNVINKGKIKLRDVYQVMPFENTIVKLKMKGKDIYELIRDNLKPDRTSMYVSGIIVKYKVENDNVSDIVIEINGQPIDPEKEYIVATNNYLVNGGSGGRAFNNAITKQDTMIPVRDALIEWIKTKKEINKPDTLRFIRME
jgi:2',3'-cyclic-nucleotide 2'-phosphodiesterase/3'-nucleotidase